MESVGRVASDRLSGVELFSNNARPYAHFYWLCFALLGLGVGLTGCANPVGADKTATVFVYRQTHENAISQSAPGPETLSVLNRFDQVEQFAKSPDATLRLLHTKAVESKDRGLQFALAELNYITGERLRRGVKPWEQRDARDYYLASAVYAWFFLFG